MPEEAVIVSAGKAQAIRFDINNAIAEEAAAIENVNTGGQNTDSGEQGSVAAEGAAAVAPEMTIDQMKSFFKAQGIEFDGNIEELKSKFAPAGTTPTPEQIEAQKAAKEKRMLDLYLTKNGKVEDFVAIKQLMTADPIEVSKTQLHKELIDNGFDEEEAKSVAKQLSLEADLEGMVWDEDGDETEKEFEARKAKLEKQVAYGAKKVAALGEPVISKAKQLYENLENEIKALDEEAAEEAELSVKIDSHLKALPRTVTVEIGKIGETDIPPVDYPIAEETVIKVSKILKDKVKRDELFYKDGELNYAFLSELLIAKETSQSIAKSSFIEGGNRQVEIWKSRFPEKSAYSVGVGGAASREIDKNAPQSAGKPQRVTPKFQ